MISKNESFIESKKERRDYYLSLIYCLLVVIFSLVVANILQARVGVLSGYMACWYLIMLVSWLVLFKHRKNLAEKSHTIFSWMIVAFTALLISSFL